MCGIVGIIGSSVKEDIVSGLKDLEYRGYDSAGILIKNKARTEIVKSIGNISKLQKECANMEDGTLGLGHTRWATHGKPNQSNCHPHSSEDNVWHLVHNGIIENYMTLKTKMQNDGVVFYGQTDTEVVAKLLGFTSGTTPLSTISQVIQKLEGSFALGIVNVKHNKIYATKRFSPLYIGVSENKSMLASDVSVIAKYTDKYISLEDDEVAIISLNHVAVYKNMKLVSKPILIVQKEDNEYIEDETQMKKEIGETRTKVLKTLAQTDYKKILTRKYNKAVLIGCGTAYHSAIMGSRYIERIAKISSESYIASEYRYGEHIIDPDTLYILVSQSGETADTIACAELIKTQADTLALTNQKYCNLNNICKYSMQIYAGKEIGVASTKAYACQLASLLCLSYTLANKNTKPLIEILENKPTKTYDFTKLIDSILSHEKVFFIGRDMDYITAMESALKLKEISYINCIAIPSGELKHGTLALIDNKSLVIVIETIQSLHEKTLSSINEIKARGGDVIVFSVMQCMEYTDLQVYKLQACEPYLDTITSITPFHTLAYETCIRLGQNPDQPRNLAKSVTVE